MTDEEICDYITELEKTSTSLTTTDNDVNNDAKLDDVDVTQFISDKRNKNIRKKTKRYLLVTYCVSYNKFPIEWFDMQYYYYCMSNHSISYIYLAPPRLTNQLIQATENPSSSGKAASQHTNNKQLLDEAEHDIKNYYLFEIIQEF